MDTKLDLVEILKNCPSGMKLYSPYCGEVELDSVCEDCADYPIMVRCDGRLISFTRDGRLYTEFPDGECALFPAKNQRDWGKSKMPVKKFDYSILKPFDKVLVRNSDSHSWRANFLSHIDCGVVYCVNMVWGQTIPYNDETKHLVGTTDMPDKKYIWWK